MLLCNWDLNIFINTFVNKSINMLVIKFPEPFTDLLLSERINRLVERMAAFFRLQLFCDLFS
jgi:hypothetical protein